MGSSINDTDEAAVRSGSRLNHPLILSHGTISCRSIADSRPFYEEFLGLDCVRHNEKGLLLRRGGNESIVIVCLEVGDHVTPVDRQHHWGLDLESPAAVDRALELAHLHKARYGIQQISRITHHHGTYSFYFKDLDGNYWEFQHADDCQRPGHNAHYDKFFERGDVV